MDDFSTVMREVTDGIKSVVKSELRLAKAELKVNGSKVGKNTALLAAFGATAVLGLLPFIAFLVIGLGDLLHNYWLSALIVSIVFFAVGGFGALVVYRKLKQTDLKMTNTRDSLNESIRTIEARIGDVTDIAKARALRRTPTP